MLRDEDDEDRLNAKFQSTKEPSLHQSKVNSWTQYNEETLIWHNLEIKQTYMEFSALKTYIKDQNLMVMAGFHSLSYRTYLVLKLNISNKSGIRSLVQLY